MDTKLLLSFPPLSNLTILHRPPLKNSSLTFPSDLFAGGHPHATPIYSSDCLYCTRWLIQTNTSEYVAVSNLPAHFPSLREVLITRLVFSEFTPLNKELYSNPRAPCLNKTYTEKCRSKLDVVIWRVLQDEEGLDSFEKEEREEKITIKMDNTYQKFWWRKDGLYSGLSSVSMMDDGATITHTLNPKILSPWDL